METTTFERRWYIVSTIPAWERKVSSTLTLKKIENFCPLNKVVKIIHGRKRVVEEPLFSSWLFVKTTQKQLTDICNIKGVTNVLYWLNKPAIISNDEIEFIEIFLKKYADVRLEKIRVQTDDNHQVTQGILREHEGKVVASKNNSIRLVLPSIGFKIIADMPDVSVKIIDTTSKSAFIKSSFKDN
jgi:transcription antitermination factor NusG